MRQPAAPLEVVTHSPEETVELGRRLARALPRSGLVILEGELGSGKTTLTKGIVSGLGAGREEEVTSPSFTLVHEYGSERKVYHADLYRIEGRRDLSTLGLEEALDQGSILIVEWGEKLGPLGSQPQIQIKIEMLTEDTRRFTVVGL